MSKIIDVLNTEKPEWVSWIEEAIAKGYFKYFEYKNFHNIQEIGSGVFGKVFRAKWKNSHNYLALKSFYNLNNTTVKEIVHEVITTLNISSLVIYVFHNLKKILKF